MKIKQIYRKNHRVAWPIYVAAAICISFSSLHATGNSGIGYHAAPFLRISPAARQVAMGEAAVALADDINLLRYNIGGLGNLHKVMLAANFHNWFEDTQQGGVSLAFPSKYGVLGVDFLYFNEGEIEEVDEFFRKTGGTGHSDDIMLTFGYGSYLKLLNNNLSLGASVKVLRQTLVGEQSTTLALDVGSQLRLKHISVGATVQNIGLSRVKFYDLASSLPEIFKLGTAFRLPINESAKLNIAADIGWTSKENLRYFLGGEVDLSDLLALRTGYKFHDVALSPWSAGFGCISIIFPIRFSGASCLTQLSTSVFP